MNKAMLCTLIKGREKKKILIIKDKIDTAAHNLEVDYQLQDTDPNVQQLINSQVGQKLEVEFLEEAEWELNSKKMFISDFNYAYDLSSLKDFIDSLILFKADDQEIDIGIIEILKNDIFSAADFWENENIDQDLTAELILKYWDLEPVQSYPDNDYYKKLMQFADGKIETIDQETADIWFDIPTLVRVKINELIEAGAIDFENYLIYLQTRDNIILYNLLLGFLKEAAGEGQESIHNLFEKFHYQLIDELTKYSLEADQKIDLNPIIPHNDSKRDEFKLQPELEMKNFSLLEIFNHYSIEINFNELNLFAENSIESSADYLESLSSHIEYLNRMREKLKCDGCGELLDYELDYLQETAAYRVEAARCNNLDCDKFDQEINLGG